MIKTAVIGYGFSAKCFHIPFIDYLNEFQLIAVSSSKSKDVKNELNSVICYKTADDLIRQTDAELVVITAPNHAHFSLAKSCLLANKHVILEKPMVTTVEEGEELISLASEKELMLSVYHNRRWDGDFLTVKALIEHQELGDVHLFESSFDRFRPHVREKWKEKAGEGTGVWFDLGSHLLDQAIQLFGKPLAITARCLCLREGSEATDYFHVLLHYENLEVSLRSSPFCAHDKLRYRIEGTKGSYQKYHLDPQEADLLINAPLDSKDWGREPERYYGSLCTDEKTKIIPTLAGGYQCFYQQIEEAINQGGKAPVDAQDALFVIKLLKLAEESSDLGRTLYL